MPLKDNEGKAREAFDKARTPKPEAAPAPPPSRLTPQPAPRPPGVAQEVHTNVESAKRAQVSPQLREDKASEFKKRMLAKQEFNRAARDRRPSDRGR